MIVIVGAGIAGLSLAWELVQQGAEVTVLEAGTIASGASGVATSYLEQRPGNTPLRLAEQESVRLWPAWAARIEQASGMDVDFRNDGQIRVALAQDLAKFEREIDVRAQQGYPVHTMTGDEARVIEPALGETIVAGALLSDVCWVTGDKLCVALTKAIRLAGGKVQEHRRVSAIANMGDGIEISLAENEKVFARKLVLCCGGEAATISGLPDDIPQSRVVRGVNLVVDQSGLAQPVRHLIKHHRGTLCPRSGGQLIVGTTYDADEHSLQPEPQVIEKLYANAEPILPGLRSLPLIAVTAGLRSKIGDGLLRLGRSVQSPLIHYSLSHAGAGFLRAPLVAREFAGFVVNGEEGKFTGPILRT